MCTLERRLSSAGATTRHRCLPRQPRYFTRRAVLLTAASAEIALTACARTAEFDPGVYRSTDSTCAPGSRLLYVETKPGNRGFEKQLAWCRDSAAVKSHKDG